MKYLLLFCSILVVSCTAEEGRTLEIPDGKVGLIGYGSLTSSKQMQSQLGKAYDRPVEVVHLKGLQRTWTGTTPNILEFPPVNYLLSCAYQNDTILPSQLTVLNIEENDGISMNCCFFIIDEEDLITIDLTEGGYSRIDVTNRIEEFEVTKGTVWAYQSDAQFYIKPDTTKPLENTLPQLYLDFLEAGFSELGEDYRNEFYATTAPIPTSIILDCEFIK